MEVLLRQTGLTETTGYKGANSSCFLLCPQQVNELKAVRTSSDSEYVWLVGRLWACAQDEPYILLCVGGSSAGDCLCQGRRSSQSALVRTEEQFLAVGYAEFVKNAGEMMPDRDAGNA